MTSCYNWLIGPDWMEIGIMSGNMTQVKFIAFCLKAQWYIKHQCRHLVNNCHEVRHSATTVNQLVVIMSTVVTSQPHHFDRPGMPLWLTLALMSSRFDLYRELRCEGKGNCFSIFRFAEFISENMGHFKGTIFFVVLHIPSFNQKKMSLRIIFNLKYLWMDMVRKSHYYV